MNSEYTKLALSSDDAIRIIETSAKCGVESLKFLDLEIKFGKPTEPATVLPGGSANAYAPYPVAEMTETQHKKQSHAALERGEIELREEQLAELALTNPLEFERMLNQGELEDDTDDSDDDPAE